jgi:hypothetical protein
VFDVESNDATNDVAEAWDAWEADWYADQQRRADKMRVKGYAIACLNHATKACKALDTASRSLVRARNAADRAQKQMVASLERAELAARVVVADNPEWTAEVAQCLEECFG